MREEKGWVAAVLCPLSSVVWLPHTMACRRVNGRSAAVVGQWCVLGKGELGWRSVALPHTCNMAGHLQGLCLVHCQGLLVSALECRDAWLVCLLWLQAAMFEKKLALLCSGRLTDAMAMQVSGMPAVGAEPCTPPLQSHADTARHRPSAEPCTHSTAQGPCRTMPMQHGTGPLQNHAHLRVLHHFLCIHLCFHQSSTKAL